LEKASAAAELTEVDCNHPAEINAAESANRAITSVGIRKIAELLPV
jgi:hypothetical protein